VFAKSSPGTPASDGAADDCVIDKIQSFAAELANPATDLEEQIVALKFLLHFVGDMHEPLHASDDHDRGGNDKCVSAQAICITFGTRNLSISSARTRKRLPPI
jgi:hypothetical protein